jgi:hypothetical protein
VIFKAWALLRLARNARLVAYPANFSLGPNGQAAPRERQSPIGVMPVGEGGHPKIIFLGRKESKAKGHDALSENKR